MNIVRLPPRSSMPSDTADLLREIADRIDAGEVSNLVAAYVDVGGYQILMASTPQDGLVLSTLLHRRCTDKFFV